MGMYCRWCVSAAVYITWQLFKFIMSSQVEKTAFDSWQGRISLGFESRNQQTFLTERQHHGPLLVQRPFYPEGPVCHVYLIHPPGGVVGGDQLEISVDCKQNTEIGRAHV